MRIAPATARVVLMDARRHVEVSLELEIDAEPIAGRVRLGGAAPRAFSGWLGLAAALEDALTTGPQPLDGSGAAEEPAADDGPCELPVSDGGLATAPVCARDPEQVEP